MPTITTKIESARGCGYRKPGGIYLISDGPGEICYRLPIPLTVCPCCSAGIKPARGFTWISGELIKSTPCKIIEGRKSALCCCPIADGLVPARLGLIWVGEAFYPEPSKFIREAQLLGISRRIAQIPKDLVIGETWIAFAHRKAIATITGSDVEFEKGIFYIFRPTRIEYVVTGKETDEELERLEKRGLSLVKVVPDTEAQIIISEDWDKDDSTDL